MILRPPESTRTYNHLPYPDLFRYSTALTERADTARADRDRRGVAAAPGGTRGGHGRLDADRACRGDRPYRRARALDRDIAQSHRPHRPPRGGPGRERSGTCPVHTRAAPYAASRAPPRSNPFSAPAAADAQCYKGSARELAGRPTP